MGAIEEFARELKNRNNPAVPSITTGIVLAEPPEPVIKLTDSIILQKNHLVFAEHMLKDYERKVELNESGVETDLKTLDNFKVGDEVILIPTFDQQLYYVIDKAVRFA